MGKISGKKTTQKLIFCLNHLTFQNLIKKLVYILSLFKSDIGFLAHKIYVYMFINEKKWKSSF